MRSLAKRWLLPFLDPRRLLLIFRVPRFWAELRTYKCRSSSEQVLLADTYPCLTDRTSTTPFDPHYFYQGAWIARKLAGSNPTRHVDVGSSVLTISVLSGHVPTIFLDYRPLAVGLPGLGSIAASVSGLPFADGSISSLSCLHVIEHIGLGRYGDPIDPDGTFRALDELQRVTSRGGRLYLSVPVGRERVCFNAHRVLCPDTVLQRLNAMELISFSLVDDEGRYHPDCDVSCAGQLDYGCGLFELSKH